MTKPPPPLFLPLNRDPAHAIEQAIAVLNTIVEKHPEVRRDFDCESFIHHELTPALEAKRAEAWIEEELKDGDRICEAAGVQRTEGGRLQVAKIIAKLSARPEEGPYISAYEGALDQFAKALEHAIANPSAETAPPIIKQYADRLRAAETKRIEYDCNICGGIVHGPFIEPTVENIMRGGPHGPRSPRSPLAATKEKS